MPPNLAFLAFIHIYDAVDLIRYGIDGACPSLGVGKE